MRDKLLTYLFMIIAVPIAGELKFYPFDGSDIRVSLGTPVFFFILLWSRRSHPVMAGFFTGIAVVVFRIFLNGLQDGSFNFQSAFFVNLPVFFYYLTFASLFYIFKINRLNENPFLIGWYGVLLEITSSLVEISIRISTAHSRITVHTFFLIAVVAIIRSFFVLGFFNILILRETRLEKAHIQERTEQILLLISNLYVEMFQLKKSTINAEQLTSTCYMHYRDLKKWENHEQAKVALNIAGNLHEIKKDNQRIYAGLSKLMIKENLDDFMNIEEVINIIIRSNKNYGEMLGKTIHYQVNISGVHPQYLTFILFSLINNLVANAVEAIPMEGRIVLTVERVDDMVKIKINDNGCGIPAKNKPFIFVPGFTTKFDQIGVASNGIGLSYIKSVIENIGGKMILVDSTQAEGTTFEILLPVASLTDKG